ncbi:5-(carboxyamino)imidazole ribonucleotide synthase [Kaustia mangrovi]|uniref:N5-carboxyaminoimidazole ribonucleotide synthase n=1 Tax=Kaustia mangrovi TaxID=2593653 RepID=A0A7S8C2F9_9HYPH|nr:5-(carboxyamino)imidazole ribonucleotide synthase [Kaustia mangrovi]QPC42160.1 5-(carboxyamino)imidazole ribonucleotide synthase [Kaustia mangrovi]
MADGASTSGPLAPCGTIGILGGGQLGRMLATAAAELGLNCHVYCPDPDSPAFDVVSRSTCAAYDDEAALAAFARNVDRVTFEFENVPHFTVDFLSSRVPVLPGAETLRITQDRLEEKRFVEGIGYGCAPYEPVDNLDDLRRAVDRLGRPCVLKTRRFGYDGKGQVTIREGDDLAEAWAAIGTAPAILEGFVPFLREVSVLAARSPDGTIACYDIAENRHENHILKISRVPAAIAPQAEKTALEIGRRAAEALNYVGVLAIELFVVERGGEEDLLVNELAPRVHNSGHWTQDGCLVSQFSQHMRAVAGWPLGSPQRLADVEMTNLLGHDVDDWARLARDPDTAVHIYAKTATRPGRKMGHANRLIRRRQG